MVLSFVNLGPGLWAMHRSIWRSRWIPSFHIYIILRFSSNGSKSFSAFLVYLFVVFFIVSFCQYRFKILLQSVKYRLADFFRIASGATYWHPSTSHHYPTFEPHVFSLEVWGANFFNKPFFHFRLSDPFWKKRISNKHV